MIKNKELIEAKDTIELNIKKNLLSLDQVRTKQDKIKGAYNKIYEMFTEANKELIANLNKTSEHLSMVESSIRTDAVELYGLTGDKKIVGGVGIRVRESLIYEASMALEWAKESKQCLTLDKKAFEKVAKVLDIEFVKKREEPSATLPSKIKFDEIGIKE